MISSYRMVQGMRASVNLAKPVPRSVFSEVPETSAICAASPYSKRGKKPQVFEQYAVPT